MERLTIGQVVDRMELDEVAIKVDGNFGDVDVEGYVRNTTGLFFDTNDHNKLKSLTGAEITICKTFDEEDEEFLVIIKRDVYERAVDVATKLLESYKNI